MSKRLLNLQAKIEHKKLYKILELDPKVFPECHSKEVRSWRWRKIRHVIFVVHHKGDSWDIKPLE
jgi:hypothetical protein